jgi:hypothetical protein
LSVFTIALKQSHALRILDDSRSNSALQFGGRRVLTRYRICQEGLKHPNFGSLGKLFSCPHSVGRKLQAGCAGPVAAPELPVSNAGGVAVTEGDINLTRRPAGQSLKAESLLDARTGLRTPDSKWLERRSIDECFQRFAHTPRALVADIACIPITIVELAEQSRRILFL